MPGNHDVEWWRRPLVPFASHALYRKYVRYFGAELTPTLTIPGAVIAGALTSHGVAWGSLTFKLRDLAVKGHLPPHGARPLAPGPAAHRRVGRRARALRPRPPGERGPARRARRDLHREHPVQARPRGARVELQLRDHRAHRHPRDLLPVGGEAGEVPGDGYAGLRPGQRPVPSQTDPSRQLSFKP